MKLYEQPKMQFDLEMQKDVLSVSQTVSPDWQDDPFATQLIDPQGGVL